MDHITRIVASVSFHSWLAFAHICAFVWVSVAQCEWVGWSVRGHLSHTWGHLRPGDLLGELGEFPEYGKKDLRQASKTLWSVGVFVFYQCFSLSDSLSPPPPPPPPQAGLHTVIQRINLSTMWSVWLKVYTYMHMYLLYTYMHMYLLIMVLRGWPLRSWKILKCTTKNSTYPACVQALIVASIEKNRKRACTVIELARSAFCDR